MRLSLIISLLALTSACGSRRVAGYLEDLENSLTTSTGTNEMDTAADSLSSDDTSSSEGSAETTTDGLESPGMTATGGGSDASGVSDTTETGWTTESSRGGPTECGNGILEVAGDEPEECDDGNLEPDDGCSQTCALDRGVFVTSLLYKGAEVQSLYLADALCGNRADDQGLVDALKYRAWLSDSETNARDRFVQGRGRLVMVNGLVLAASWPALLAGELENPLEITEKSETYQGGVWTGTRPDGSAVPQAEHCDDWSSSSVLKKGYYGYSDRATSEWTFAEDDDQPSSCPSSYALYCFQSL